MKYKLLMCLIAVVFCLITPIVHANADNTRDNNYIYDFWGNPRKSLPAFDLITTIDITNMGDTPLSSIDDIFADENKIYIIDSVESRLDIFDKQYNLVTSIKLIRDKDGNIIVDKDTNAQLMLKNPEGVFVDHNTDEIYIADTGAQRIVVLDAEKYYLKRVIKAPNGIIGTTVFKPSKIVVDDAGRIFVIVQNSHDGIVELYSDGSFAGYFGVDKPKVNIIDFIWRSFASDVQKEKMRKVYAPAFNNLDIDQEGFIYATTFDASATDKVVRLNPKGENVIRVTDNRKIIGDLIQDIDQQPSMFVDIAVSNFGAYALLDKTRGRIFIYNFDGDLLNVFGGLGDVEGDFKEPSGIDWFNDKLVVADKKLNKVFIFGQTEFGKAALGAEENYYFGRWDEAAILYKKALELNANYEIAYVGIGKNLLMQDKYKEAMYYLKLGNSKEYYSKAYNGYRNEMVRQNFIWIMLVFLMFIGYILYSEYKYQKQR